MLTPEESCATISTEEAGKMLRLSDRQVRELCHRGHLKTLPRNEGEPYRILLESLHRMINQALHLEEHDMHPHPMPERRPMEAR